MFARCSKGWSAYGVTRQCDSPAFIIDLSLDISIVPILVGAIGTVKEEHYGRILAPFLARDDTFCVVSSDFCHWYVDFPFNYHHLLMALLGARAFPIPSTILSIHQSIHRLCNCLGLLPSGLHPIFPYTSPYRPLITRQWSF